MGPLGTNQLLSFGQGDGRVVLTRDLPPAVVFIIGIEGRELNDIKELSAPDVLNFDHMDVVAATIGDDLHPADALSPGPFGAAEELLDLYASAKR